MQEAGLDVSEEHMQELTSETFKLRKSQTDRFDVYGILKIAASHHGTYAVESSDRDVHWRSPRQAIYLQSKSTCLKDFSAVYEADKVHRKKRNKALYDFFFRSLLKLMS